jgi:sugar lactone lactonase YvrE
MPQSSKHVEQLAPELERIVSPSGPLWWKESRYLLFSDIHNNRLWSPAGSPTLR